MNKKELRKSKLNIRNTMEPRYVITKSESVCRLLLENDWYADAEYIYAYYPLGNELDLRSFIEKAWSDGKRVCLPKVKGLDMDFYEVKSFDELSEGAFHVMEPDANRCSISNADNAVVLVPGVCFDKEGNRIGFGAGYYDRYFERYPKLIRLGVCYDFQMVDEIPADAFDVKMDGVICS